jgi:enoyl-CoA hydratase/carnithine racemase
VVKTDHLRYEKDNAISRELGQAMGAATADFEADEQLRVLIVTLTASDNICNN